MKNRTNHNQRVEESEGVQDLKMKIEVIERN